MELLKKNAPTHVPTLEILYHKMSSKVKASVKNCLWPDAWLGLAVTGIVGWVSQGEISTLPDLLVSFIPTELPQWEDSST